MSTHASTATFLLAIGVLLLAFVGAVPSATAQAQPTNVTISEIQEPTDDTDDSPYNGTNVTTVGTVTAVGDDGFFIQNGTGAWNGIYVYGATDVQTGDKLTVTGAVKEYNGLTEIDVTGTAAAITTRETDVSIPAPVHVSTADAGTEPYESVLVNITDLSVT